MSVFACTAPLHAFYFTILASCKFVPDK